MKLKINSKAPSFELPSTASDKFFLKDERECLAACCGAPMMQVDHRYYENLTIEKIDQIIGDLDNER